MKKTLLSSILLAACSFHLAACLGSKDVEESITKKFKEEGVELKSASCPNVKSKEGEKFDCKAQDFDGTEFAIHVTVTKDGMSWEQEGKIIETDKLGAVATVLAGAEIDSCGAKKVVAFDGRKLKCKKKGGGELTFKFDKDLMPSIVDGDEKKAETPSKSESSAQPDDKSLVSPDSSSEPSKEEPAKEE